jgi:hypothetical protein
MDEATYATIPKTLTLRMIRFNIIVPGRRTRAITVVTTLVDPNEYSAEAIAELYGYRWNVELDIRQIKQTLNCGGPGLADSGRGRDNVPERSL